MEGREETNPYIADLTKNVITQEFTNCSIKAVRLADRIKEWHDKQSKHLLEEIERLKENQIPEYLIEFVDDVKHMIKLYNNSSFTRSEQYRDKLSEKLDDIRTIDLNPNKPKTN